MLTPLKAIRAKCLDCCCSSAHEVSLCPCPDCSLYPYRFGKNPNRAGVGNKAAIPPKTPTQPTDSQHDATSEGNYTTIGAGQ